MRNLFIITSCALGLFAGCATPVHVSRFPAGAAVDRGALWASLNHDCLNPAGGAAKACVSGSGEQALDKGYVIYKDPKGPTHFLLIPTVPVPGIESPIILDAEAPNYWEGAWEGRLQVAAVLQKQLQRNMTAFAANPPFARSQDQLHIHIDCVRPEVIQLITTTAANVDTSTWNPIIIDVPKRGLSFTYRFKFIPGEDLTALRPFMILNQSLAAEAGSLPIKNHTLVLIGATLGGQDGFYFLDGSTLPADPDPTHMDPNAVHGEDLLDASCAIAK